MNDPAARGLGWRGAVLAAIVFFASTLFTQAAPAVAPDAPREVAEEGADPFYAFDDFAWRAFLALNWPAGADGGPDRAARPADAGARVWERFAARDNLAASRQGDPCGAGAGEKVVSAFSAFAEFNQTSFTPGEPDAPLVARNGTYVRYETRFGGFGPGPSGAAQWLAPPGAVAVKAAWRLLTSADGEAFRARYYVAKGAWVTDVAASRAAGRVVCGHADLALVGLHIVVRTANSPQGVWASFEHVDNVPAVGVGETREPDAREAGLAYAFNDPKRPREIWPPRGWRAASPVSLENPPDPAPAPSQVIRAHPIRREIMAANRAYWAQPEVAASVWRRYMLVAVQWPTVSNPRGPQNDGRYFPGLPPEPGSKAMKYKIDEADDARNIANSVMETYRQDPPASCMACHQAVGNARGYDFVGAFGAAAARN
jgi:hypothetical protein